MKRLFKLLIVLLLCSCVNANKKKVPKLEMEIINKELIACRKVNDTIDFDVFKEKSINHLKYKLTNNDSVAYYINVYSASETLKYAYFALVDSGAGVVFTNSKQDTCKTKYGSFSSAYQEYDAGKLNFIIHPKETIYFTNTLYLPVGFNSQLADVLFDYKDEYSASLFIYNDSINRYITPKELAKIKSENAKTFRGLIVSKNKIPVTFIDCD